MGSVSTYKPRRAKCHECGKGMIKKHSCQKYHPSCRKIVKARQSYDWNVRSGYNKNPGAGNGRCPPQRTTCDECSKVMIRRSPSQRFHPSCAKKVDARNKRESAIRSGKFKNPGRGTGPLPGEDHPRWAGGSRGWQQRHFRGTECERCGSKGEMHLHHRDREVSNWKDGNLETLCVPCHKEEHKDDGGVMYAAA